MKAYEHPGRLVWVDWMEDIKVTGKRPQIGSQRLYDGQIGTCVGVKQVIDREGRLWLLEEVLMNTLNYEWRLYPQGIQEVMDLRTGEPKQ